MEGYLFKKGSGESSFGRRNWKRRWFVLDGLDLEYYENIDLVTGVPVAKKGEQNLKGYEAKEISHHEKKFVFVLQNSQGNQIHLCADDERSMNLWIKAIHAAINGENAAAINYEDLYSRLGLNMKDDPDASAINRAYRKKALKAHPDKGYNEIMVDIFEFVYLLIPASV